MKFRKKKQTRNQISINFVLAKISRRFTWVRIHVWARTHFLLRHKYQTIDHNRSASQKSGRGAKYKLELTVPEVGGTVMCDKRGS